MGSYITIDVSDAIDYIEDGKISFILDIEENPENDANGSNSGLEFSSKESGAEKAPKLFVSNQYVTELEAVNLEAEVGNTLDLPDTLRFIMRMALRNRNLLRGKLSARLCLAEKEHSW